MKTNLGIAIFVGWMTQLGLSSLLPATAIVLGRTASMLSGGDSSWGDHASDPWEPAWHLIQASILLGSAIAAWLTGYLAPRRPALAATALILLVLVAKAFEQFPMPPSPSVLVEWVIAPCLGIVIGTMAARLTVAGRRSS
jgi:hypothetical protein